MRVLVIIFAMILFFTTVQSDSHQFKFLKPVLNEGKLVLLHNKEQQFPVLEEENDTEKITVISEILKSGIPNISLRIGEMIKVFMSHAVRNANDSRDLSVFKPSLYICLIKGGNRPKQGFYLRKGGKDIDFTSTYYIEMPPEQNGFEKIFAHENGHLLDYYILDFSEESVPFRMIHTPPAITEYSTAFKEGFGIHFEPMTEKYSKNRNLWNYYVLEDMKGKAYFMNIQDLFSMSHSVKRHAWVKGNFFAFSRIHELADNTSGDALRKKFIKNWMNTDFTMTHIKNAQQMLSCEGVCAHIFYRIVNDEAVQNNFVKNEFYQQFFVAPVTDIRKMISPLENAYLKVMYTKYRMSRNSAEYQKDLPPYMLDFVMQFINEFPDDSDSIINDFVMATYYTTVIQNAGSLYSDAYEKALLFVADSEESVKGFRSLYAEIQKIQETLKENPELIYSVLGPSLWIENTECSIEVFGERMPKLSINLNAAESYELMTIPGITVKQATDFIAAREKVGYFNNFLEIKNAKIFDSSVYSEIVKQRKAYLATNETE